MHPFHSIRQRNARLTHLQNLPCSFIKEESRNRREGKDIGRQGYECKGEGYDGGLVAGAFMGNERGAVEEGFDELLENANTILSKSARCFLMQLRN